MSGVVVAFLPSGPAAGRVNGGHLERGAVVPGDGSRRASMHKTTIDLIRVDRDVIRMWGHA
jgi:hypothetical protein